MLVLLAQASLSFYMQHSNSFSVSLKSMAKQKFYRHQVQRQKWDK